MFRSTVMGGMWGWPPGRRETIAPTVRYSRWRLPLPSGPHRTMPSAPCRERRASHAPPSVQRGMAGRLSSVRRGRLWYSVQQTERRRFPSSVFLPADELRDLCAGHAEMPRDDSRLDVGLERGPDDLRLQMWRRWLLVVNRVAATPDLVNHRIQQLLDCRIRARSSLGGLAAESAAVLRRL